MRTLAVSTLFGVVFAASLFAQDKTPIPAVYAEIQANLEWQATGVTVWPDQLICVKATGLWTHGIQGLQGITPYYGPRGFGKDQPGLVPEVVARTGALLGKIGDQGAFLIEDQLCFIPTYAGELLMQMNDIPGAFGNNAGVMKVRITIQPIR